jgi:hypothetical protein
MPEPALFIGVVSHEGSRFAVSQGPTGLAHRLAEVMPGVEVQVNVVDLLPTGSPLVSAAGVQESLTAEAQLEAVWARFLDRPRDLRWWRFRAGRRARRAWQRVRPPSPAMLQRLLNIELSHLDLLRRGLASGAPWVLILEDDAFDSDIQDLSDGLLGLMECPAGPGYVNLSASFTSRELGVEHLLRPSGVAWDGSADRDVLGTTRPVTNTVCAILYSATFLAALVEAMDALPLEPVVPIDWKLNMALMALHEADQAPPGTCWLVEPAPIAQMSMQPAAILPS